MTLRRSSSRAALTAVFRRIRLFGTIVIAVNVMALAYLLIATPKYESTAQLLFRFGADRRPTLDRQVSTMEDVSVDERTKALAGVYRALRPGGKLAVVVIATAAESPFVAMPLAIAARHAGTPEAPSGN